MKRNMVVLLLLALVLFLGAACGTSAPTEEAPEQLSAQPTEQIPAEAAETILSMGPANTEILVALGFGDQIIAIDTFSVDIEGIAPDLPAFDMMAPDLEQIIALGPDVIIATGMMFVDGIDPFQVVSEMGIRVVHIHGAGSASSIAEIQADIRHIAAAMGVEEVGEAIIVQMEWEIAKIRALVAGITEPRTVYFEIAAPPFMYSFGHGVFLHEMIELIGAVNVFADQDAWFFVADEAVPEANPDVILTNVGYVDEPVADILARPGWETISAVENGRVYFIDPDTSSRPNHHIVQALWEMVRAVYPELFG